MTYWEGNKLPVIINLQKEIKKGIVRTYTGKKFPVTLSDWLIPGIMLLDYVELEKSHVTGDWIVVDYHINHEVYDAINEDYTECDAL